MNPEERTEAVFGSFDGTVSVVGFVFGLLIHHSPASVIAIGGLAGAVSATVSMGTGAYESADGPWRRRFQNASAMALATLIGSAVPVWPFFVFSRSVAAVVSAIGCLCVAGWIGYEKRAGVKGFVTAYGFLLGAAGLALLIVAFIPASA